MSTSIKVEAAPPPTRLCELEVSRWPVVDYAEGTCERVYEYSETCYFLRGLAELQTDDGTTLLVGKGDLVTFPRGMKVRWRVTEKIVQHSQTGQLSANKVG